MGIHASANGPLDSFSSFVSLLFFFHCASCSCKFDKQIRLQLQRCGRYLDTKGGISTLLNATITEVYKIVYQILISKIDVALSAILNNAKGDQGMLDAKPILVMGWGGDLWLLTQRGRVCKDGSYQASMS